MNAERLILAALAREWRSLNWRLFREALRPPTFALGRGGSLGTWNRRTRSIELDRDFLATRPWGEVVEVLKHEMAHQYAHEVLGAVDESAHGPAFREVCERLGIDAASRGVPASEDKILRRVQKLLALAQSPERAEAEAAMAAAQRMMLEHNLGAAPSAYTWRHLGPPATRTPSHTKIIGGILTAWFFVDAIWVEVFDVHSLRHATVLEVCGSPENVEMAAYVWDFLHQAGERLWLRHKREQGIVGDRDRRRFLAGVATGFHRKQGAQRRENEAAGLVWSGDPRLKAWYRRRHPSVRKGRGAGVVADDSYRAGIAHGAELVLHKPVTGTATARGRLIG